MSKIRVLSDHLANQIAAGEVVERPASVAKELVENAIDAGARRIEVDAEAGGVRLLRVTDDGEGMTRDDAVLAFERHATSKISTAEDLTRIATLGFRGEALASIASVARIELITQREDETEGARVVIEAGRMRDVAPAAHPRGTRITARDLFFNVPARRKFLRSEATETFHLTNLVTHYALAHPEISFRLTINGREALHAAPARDLRERAYQIFGAGFIENLLEVNGGAAQVAIIKGFVSAPHERRTTRDAQFLFVNGRFVRDRLIARSLTEAFRGALPQGAHPAALLFLEVPLEAVDVNVHPAKTEVRFRRAAAVADAVREAVRHALAGNGYVANPNEDYGAKCFTSQSEPFVVTDESRAESESAAPDSNEPIFNPQIDARRRATNETVRFTETQMRDVAHQERIGFVSESSEVSFADEATNVRPPTFRLADSQASGDESQPDRNALEAKGESQTNDAAKISDDVSSEISRVASQSNDARQSDDAPAFESNGASSLRSPLASIVSVAGLVREVNVASLDASRVRALGQLDETFIIATDAEGLLLIDQHIAHERILFDKFCARAAERKIESQQLLLPETFDLTPAQAIVFDALADELEACGFGVMRLSGRTAALKSVPADLPAAEARNLFLELLALAEAERRNAAHAHLREKICAAISCRAAIRSNAALSTEQMQWIVDNLLRASSPTTSPHGRPAILRLATRDLAKGFGRG